MSRATTYPAIVVTIMASLGCNQATPVSPSSAQTLVEGVWADIGDRSAVFGESGAPARVLRVCPGGKVVYSYMLLVGENEVVELGVGRIWQGTWRVTGNTFESELRYVVPAPAETNYVPLGTQEHASLAIGPGGDALDGLLGHFVRVDRVKKSSLRNLRCGDDELQ